MFVRLVRMGASFVAVVAIYSLYALIVVPIIEPTTSPVARTSVTVQPRRNLTERYRQAYGKYFRPGDWELTGTPKVLESEQAKLFVQEYNTLPDGRVKLHPCTLLFFPNPGKKEADGEEQVIMMRAPEGAILQFDEAFDLRRAKVGKLLGGRLVGKVTITSTMNQSGTAEDLLIVTHDVELSNSRVFTPNAVQFRFGKNQGSGREMSINLVKTDAGPSRGPAAEFGEIESFELVRDVRLHLEIEPDADRRNPSGDTSDEPQSPVEVTCQGPFRFDVARSLATFSDQVDVLRLNDVGQSDQLNCELLAIQFGPRERKSNAASKPPRIHRPARDDSPDEAKANPFDLEPRRLEAIGDPVVIRAPSQGGYARCQRLEYDLLTGRIVMEGNESIQLHHGQSELRTRRFDYRPGENGRLGWLQIAGPGSLHGVLEDRTHQKYQAQWQNELRMRPQDQTQVVSIVGSAKVRFSEMGALSADEIHVWLLENQQPAPPEHSTAEVVLANYRPGSTSNLPEPARPAAQPMPAPPTQRRARKQTPATNIVPDRMLAEGNVLIDSTQVTGGAKRLEVWFQQADDASAAAATSASEHNSRGGGLLASRTPTQTFDVRGDLMRLQLRMRGNVTRVEDVSIEGRAKLVETHTRNPGEAPLTVQGDRVQMAQADSDDAQVNVSGKPAMVEARGLALVGGRINLDRATNRMWIDGPGRMKLPINRDFSGNALGQQQDMTVDWQGGMQFDGQTARFDRAVNARGEHQNLRTESLEVTLRKRIDFNQPQMPGDRRDRRGAGGNEAEVERVTCRGGVTIQNKTFDGDGQLSTEQMQMRDISINQVSGVIEGRGPGWITTVRRGVAGGLGFPGATPAANPPAESKGYSFLNVRFEGPIGGNVHRHELSFSEQVRAVYGPVKDWTAELDPDTPDELDPQAVLLNCDKLVVRQMTAIVRGQRATVELETIGNTLVEGQTFTARAHKMSFAEAKDLLVLEGNGSVDAQLFRQTTVGGPTSQAAARRIMYWRNTNRVEVDDARFLDIGNLGSSKPGSNNHSGFPNLFPRQKEEKNPLSTGSTRTPSGNGTALPAFRR